jgi:hypothetical protein
MANTNALTKLIVDFDAVMMGILANALTQEQLYAVLPCHLMTSKSLNLSRALSLHSQMGNKN